VLQILLRLVHIVSGGIWVGMVVFTTAFLMPALTDVGPDAGKVMAALAKRRIMMVMPLLAILTIGSGIWLMIRFSGGNGGAAMQSPMGRLLGVGALAAIIAFLLGLTIVRPTMTKIAAYGADPTKRDEIARLRQRGDFVNQLVALLLVIALTAMAVARYA
jgi:uncharacterized membrane protein